MNIRLNGHHYTTNFTLATTSRLSKQFGGYNTPICRWFTHGDDCCDYWTPINDPRAVRALMLDDELGRGKK